jgi:hypothetical protein
MGQRAREARVAKSTEHAGAERRRVPLTSPRRGRKCAKGVPDFAERLLRTQIKRQHTRDFSEPRGETQNTTAKNGGSGRKSFCRAFARPRGEHAPYHGSVTATPIGIQNRKFFHFFRQGFSVAPNFTKKSDERKKFFSQFFPLRLRAKQAVRDQGISLLDVPERLTRRGHDAPSRLEHRATCVHRSGSSCRLPSRAEPSRAEP